MWRILFVLLLVNMITAKSIYCQGEVDVVHRSGCKLYGCDSQELICWNMNKFSMSMMVDNDKRKLKITC